MTTLTRCRGNPPAASAEPSVENLPSGRGLLDQSCNAKT